MPKDMGYGKRKRKGSLSKNKKRKVSNNKMRTKGSKKGKY